MTINKDVLERAKKLIPNLSFFVELKLREFLALVENNYAGGGIRTHAGRAQWLSRPPPYHSATPACYNLKARYF